MTCKRIILESVMSLSSIHFVPNFANEAPEFRPKQPPGFTLAAARNEADAIRPNSAIGLPGARHALRRMAGPNDRKCRIPRHRLQAIDRNEMHGRRKEDFEAAAGIVFLARTSVHPTAARNPAAV